LHPAGTQTKLTQRPLWQSIFPRQFCVSGHCWLSEATQLPPQSRSVSLPFSIPSVQLGARQIGGTAAVSQLALTQSPSSTHSPASGQGPQVSPQSTSVSVPFCTLSVQLGSTHSPAVQMSDTQSSLTTQSAPGVGQAAQLAPPQSTSLSPLLRIESEQVAARHTEGTATMSQLLLAQSESCVQPAGGSPGPGSAQAAHTEPPQSTSDSSPS
jgi:hypothetical protein